MTKARSLVWCLVWAVIVFWVVLYYVPAPWNYIWCTLLVGTWSFVIIAAVIRAKRFRR